jgi:YegS/Rv2252/BmrU family lipid kinase
MPRVREVLACISRSSGGVARGDREADEIRAALASAGMAARVELLEGGVIVGLAQQSAADGAKLIIVGGGDGSISAAAGVLAGTSTKLGILPLGTRNHFARDLGIPMKLDEAAKLIASGKSRKVDVADVNGRVFLNNSAIGLYPLMVIDRDLQRERLGRSKRLAMLIASARTLARFDHHRLILTVNEEKERVDTPLLFVGNNDYRLDLRAPGRRESLDDGKLCVFVMRKKTRGGLIAASIRALFGRTRENDMVKLENVERLRVTSRRRHLPVSIDGEVAELRPPFDYKARKRALNVITP